MDYISLTISLAALIISTSTFWLTRIKKGKVKMTRPTIIFFGPDGRGKKHSKVFIRTLLYSTSDKGIYIQNMFVRLHRGESVQNFNVWVYDNSGLVRGSGLFISKTGDYLMEIFIEPVDERPKKVFEQKLTLTKNQEQEMRTKGVGTYFDWAPNNQNYFSHVDELPKENKELTDMVKLLTGDKD
jgi:hypothetical protein